jgi:two-component system sensor histidine kinase/response regulator
MDPSSLDTLTGLLRALGAPAALVRSGALLATNEDFERLHGVGDAARRVEDVVTVDAWPSTRVWLEKALATSAPVGPHLSRLRGPAGAEVDVELASVPVAGMGGLSLVLVRLRDPVAVRAGMIAELRDHFGELIDAAEEMVVVHAIDGRILFANRAAQVLVGRSEDTLLGCNVKDFTPVGQHAAVRERAATRVAGVSRRMYSYEVTVIDAAGQPQQIEISSGPILSGGEPIAVLVIGRFTEKRAARERVLEDERDAALEANQGKREFLAHFSHEVRTPINVIFGMTEMALDLDLSDEAREHIDRARFAAGTLLGLVDDVLEFSRIEARTYALRPRPFQVREQVVATVHALAPIATGRGLALTHDIAPSVPENLVGDPDRLRQILLNLISNAIKCTPAGAVHVQVAEASSPTPAGHHLRFSVSDTGVGIAIDQRARIFQPFQQIANGTGTGTGLGLAIVRELVDLLGGQIWVESEPGHGSTFHFDAVFAPTVVS